MTNEATIYVGDSNQLIIIFGEDDRTIVMDLNTEEAELVETLLGDVNFWSNFCNSLSIALSQQLGEKSD